MGPKYKWIMSNDVSYDRHIWRFAPCGICKEILMIEVVGKSGISDYTPVFTDKPINLIMKEDYEGIEEN